MFLKNNLNLIVLKFKYYRQSGSCIIDQNIIMTVQIHNFKTAWPANMTNISMPCLSSLDKMHALLSPMCCMIILTPLKDGNEHEPHHISSASSG